MTIDVQEEFWKCPRRWYKWRSRGQVWTDVVTMRGLNKRIIARNKREIMSKGCIHQSIGTESPTKGPHMLLKVSWKETQKEGRGNSAFLSATLCPFYCHNHRLLHIAGGFDFLSIVLYIRVTQFQETLYLTKCKSIHFAASFTNVISPLKETLS